MDKTMICKNKIYAAKKVFISSVQSEFAAERMMLCDYLTTDALFCKFFDVFIFEQLPAMNSDAKKVYLEEVKQCDIYLGLFGKDYGYEDKDGISPTEREFDCATENHKIKLIFLTNHTSEKREPKENQLIKKAEQFVIRKKFSSDLELKTAVYNSFVRFLEENEYIRTTPFDATFNRKATIEDLDEEKIRSFVYTAHRKRAFPFTKDTEIETVLTHLNLIENQKITNAAILLFGKNPQKFFITSEVRCAHFHGYDKVKPIPNYQVYKGNVFQLITQAVSFVLSNITVSTGARDKGVEVDVNYELPVRAVTEAIVNAVCHRDYTSNASVQVMLFKDRLEIWNPGHLPFGMTVAKLKQKHNSIPVNPLIAEPLYLAGTIERMGTGTEEMIDKCKQAGLKEPDFFEEESFTATLWRNVPVENDNTTQVATQVATQVENLIDVLVGEMNRQEIQNALHLLNREHFRLNYLKLALEQGIIEMTIPDKPNSSLQRYRLTSLGLNIKKLKR